MAILLGVSCTDTSYCTIACRTVSNAGACMCYISFWQRYGCQNASVHVRVTSALKQKQVYGDLHSIVFTIKYSRARKFRGHSLHSDQETNPLHVDFQQISATAVRLSVTVCASLFVLMKGSKSDNSILLSVRFEVLIGVTMKMATLLKDVTPWCLVGQYQFWGGLWFLHLQVPANESFISTGWDASEKWPKF